MKSFITSTSIIRMIKSMRVRGHVARMCEKKNTCMIMMGKTKRKEITRKTKT
jgi:hypothetical protein